MYIFMVHVPRERYSPSKHLWYAYDFSAKYVIWNFLIFVAISICIVIHFIFHRYACFQDLMCMAFLWYREDTFLTVNILSFGFDNLFASLRQFCHSLRIIVKFVLSSFGSEASLSWFFEVYAAMEFCSGHCVVQNEGIPEGDN